MSNEPFGGLSFIEIIEKLRSDRQFSAQFEAVALLVSNSGLDSPAGRGLLRFFAKDAAELAQLMAEANTLNDVLAGNRRTTVPGTTPGTGTTGSITCLMDELDKADTLLKSKPLAKDEPEKK